MPAALTTEGLTKRFGALTAVDDLDLDVAPSEVFGFLGPNGAGKTTTIRLLLDILRPTAGTATLLGQPPGDVAVRRHLGFLPAELHLDRRHVVAEAIAFHGALRSGFDDRGRPRAPRTLRARPGAADRRAQHRQPPEGGRRHRLRRPPRAAHARRTLVRPRPLLQHELVALIRERVADGATLFLSAHVLSEVERIADRVAILRRGRLALLGSMADLRAHARQRIDLHIAAPAEAATFDRPRASSPSRPTATCSRSRSRDPSTPRSSGPRPTSSSSGS